MIDIVTNSYFIYFFVPLITILLGIFVKIVSRNDQYITFKKEDLAVGLETAVTALLILITYSVNEIISLNKIKIPEGQKAELTDSILAVPWLILIFIVLLWGVSTVIRKLGWENADELNLFWGIILPNVFGIGSLIFVVIWISN